MRAMQIIEWGKPLEAREYPDPEPKGEEVLLRVEAAGVCHSDVHIWDGYFDLGGERQISLESRGVHLPFTMGHEIAGEVAALGPRASGVKVGDKLVAYPWIGCGECAVCRKGEELLCLNPRTLGTRRAGGYGTHVSCRTAATFFRMTGCRRTLPRPTPAQASPPIRLSRRHAAIWLLTTTW